MKRSFFLFLYLCCSLPFLLKGESVVIIHGFMTPPDSMRTIQGVVINSGFCAYVWNYSSQKKYFEEHAIDLVSYLRQIACQAPGEAIHFVAHSSGALVLRLALNRPDCPDEAKHGRAVLLGPSNQGSRLGRHFQGVRPIEWIVGDKSGWELMHLRPEQIDCFGHFPPSMAVLVIAGTKGSHFLFRGPNDGWLALEETYLRTPFFLKVFRLSHSELLTERAPLLCLRAFLTQPIEN